MGCPLTVRTSLRDCGMNGQLGQRATDGTPRDVLSPSTCPLGTVGWDRQLGQRAADGTPRSLSVHPLGTEGMGRTAETEGYR